jgi:diacylglycerol kinase family enzyme
MQVTLIHNAKAGDEQYSGDELVSLMRDAGHDVTYCSTKEKDWLLTLKAASDFVAVAGGDGTVGKVARQLIGRRIPIAVLPLGTANNISKTLEIAEVPIDRLIQSWATAKSVAFDSAIAKMPWGKTDFVESFGAGLFASVMLEAENSPAIDSSSADSEIVSALQLVQRRLQNCPFTPFNILLDEHDLSGEYLCLEVMNIRYVSSNIHLAAKANPGDGLLNVVLIGEGDRHKLDVYLSQRLAAKLQPQEHPSADQFAPLELPTYQGKHLQIQCNAVDVHVDDELKAAHDLSSMATPIEIDIEVIPHTLEFMIPA